MRTSRKARIWATTALGGVLLALAGGSSASAQEPPVYDGTDQARYRNEVGPHRPVANARWWTHFRDGELNVLLSRGLDGNFDVAVARSRLEEADALVLQSTSALLPTVSWDSSITTGPTDSLGFQFGGVGGGAGGPTPPDLYYIGSSKVVASLELDLTGRNVLTRRAAKNDKKAAQHDVQTQRQQLASQITLAYYNVVAAKAQVRAVQEQVQTNEDILALTEARFETGQANAVEVLQQRQQLAATKKLVPQAEAQVRTFEQQLSVLLGEAPGAGFVTAAELPALPTRPGLGTPSDLQRTRPDLRAAEQRVVAARKRTKSSRRQFAPSLQLQSEGGVQAIRIFDWNSQGFWSAGAVVSVPLFNGGRNLAGLKQSQAQERIAENQLSSSTLSAVREVEDALVREEQQAQTLELAEQEAEAARKAFNESRSRYAAGLSDYLTVLATLSAAQQTELGVITTHRDLLAARIDLYTALGDK